MKHRRPLSLILLALSIFIALTAPRAVAFASAQTAIENPSLSLTSALASTFDSNATLRRVGVNSSATSRAAASFNCQDTFTGINGAVKYDSQNPQQLATIAWTAQGSASCSMAMTSIKYDLAVINYYDETHTVAYKSCSGCTSAIAENVGYTCTQYQVGGMEDCAGEWRLSKKSTYVAPPGYQFNTASANCIISPVTTLTCSQQVSIGTAKLFNVQELPSCDSSGAGTACYTLPPSGVMPRLSVEAIRNIRDSHTPGGKNVDATKGLFNAGSGDSVFQNALMRALQDTTPWTQSSGNYWQKTISYPGAGTTSGGAPANQVVVVVSGERIDDQGSPMHMASEVITMYPR